MVAPTKQTHRVSQTAIADGRITVYKPPHPNRRYSAGLDFAYGLEHGDFDAAVILDETGEQAATAVGRWGENFGTIMGPLFDWFKPFIVGERSATGIVILRQFYDEGRWVYIERDENKKSRRERDTLGVPTSQKGLLLRRLQRKIGPRDESGSLLAPQLVLHDAELIEQLNRYQWRPRSRNVTIEDASDSDLIAGAPPGEHDDLVSALWHATAGIEWLPQYRPPPEKPKKGTYAAFGLGDFEADKPKPSAWK